MPFTIKATIKVETHLSTSTTVCDTPASLADFALHCLVQQYGTAGARERVEKKLAEYKPDYAGYDSLTT